MRIETKGRNGLPNGWIEPLWNATEKPELRPEQVYLTNVAPFSVKGPHLHMKRRGLFGVISGRVRIVVRWNNQYVVHDLAAGGALLPVDSGRPVAIYNTTNVAATLINMPSPAWTKEDPDDHPVDDWQDPPWWELNGGNRK